MAGRDFAHYFMDRYAGPELIDRLVKGEDQVSFVQESYLEAFEHLDLWINEGAFSPNANDLSTEEAIAQFTEGKAAMYMNGTGILRRRMRITRIFRMRSASFPFRRSFPAKNVP